MRLQRGYHHQVGLWIGAEQEYVLARVRETTFHIERMRAIVPLPDAQPQSRGATCARRRLDALHQRRRDATAVPLAEDIEPPELKRIRAGHALGQVSGAQLRIRDRTAIRLDQQRRDVAIAQLARLLINAVGAREVQRISVGSLVAANVSWKVRRASSASTSASLTLAGRICTGQW